MLFSPYTEAESTAEPAVASSDPAATPSPEPRVEWRIINDPETGKRWHAHTVYESDSARPPDVDEEEK